MIDDHPDLQRRYRAPRAFGPLPGPRNVPASERDVHGRPDEVTTALAVSLEADPAELTELLPPGLRLAGAAVLTVTVSRFENLLWLAGRGYPVLTVTIPVEHIARTGDDRVRGRFLAVLWEGLADPVTTGREELGFPKLPADIRAPRITDVSGGAVDAEACWDGFCFVDVTAEGLHPEPADEPPLPQGVIVHRYVPSLLEPGSADIDQLIHHPVRAGSKPTITTDRLSGSGRFSFHHARFVDSPVQYPVVNALAHLSLAESGPATITRTTAAPGGIVGAATPRVLGTQHLGPVPVGALA